MNAKKIALAALGAAFVFGATAPASFAAPGDRGPNGHGPRHEMGGPMMKERAFIYLLKNADADKDGKVTKAELTAFEEKKFAEIDADKDGSLTPGEFRAYRKAAMEAFRKDHPRPEREDAKADGDKKPSGERAEGKEGKRHHAKGPGRHGKGGPAMGFIRFADTDENGQVSKAEATAATEKFFAFMDTNKDGAISIDDLPDRPL
ncbi:hypothetical protein GAO09_01155 [Rhizobiales bacterium RZME27]|uniref:EF-hand domain-containing protein n=1 Tax=Endobacterium cereale TaxID=2663029 RepID=A0A6A8A542_9HYPH|nr:hypothetical protein [Endobacterium cereale]MEB2844763.1 hypothetical protein [Endobacterium cereale]MQY44680.1 hypothetical protein [Endobacterium cereale]